MAIMAWEVSELQIPTVPPLPQNGFQVRQRRFKLRARTADVQADKSAPAFAEEQAVVHLHMRLKNAAHQLFLLKFQRAAVQPYQVGRLQRA